MKIVSDFFMLSIGFQGYSSKNLKTFLAHCDFEIGFHLIIMEFCMGRHGVCIVAYKWFWNFIVRQMKLFGNENALVQNECHMPYNEISQPFVYQCIEQLRRDFFIVRISPLLRFCLKPTLYREKSRQLSRIAQEIFSVWVFLGQILVLRFYFML